MTNKIDFKKSLKPFYNPPLIGFHIVDVPVMNFLMVDGIGDPNTSIEYQHAVESLYSMSYGIKFELKSQGFDYVVPPLEGLWWMPDMAEFNLENKTSWQWTMMIMQPERVTQGIVEKVRNKIEKKGIIEAGFQGKFEIFHEGIAVQIFYSGAYENEAPVIAQMHRFIVENGYRLSGKHHEIYLSDPRKTAPEKLKTILRQPVKLD